MEMPAAQSHVPFHKYSARSALGRPCLKNVNFLSRNVIFYLFIFCEAALCVSHQFHCGYRLTIKAVTLLVHCWSTAGVNLQLSSCVE